MTWRAPLSGATADELRLHAAERRRIRPLVEAGRTECQQGIPGNGSSGTCLHPTRRIHPGQRWALGHRDDRRGWIGPVHADCNQRDAASRGGIARKARRTRERRSIRL